MKSIVSAVLALGVVTLAARAGAMKPLAGAFGASPEQPRHFAAPHLRMITAPVVAAVVLSQSSRTLSTSVRNGVPDLIGTVHGIPGAPAVSDSDDPHGEPGLARWRWHGTATARGAARLRLYVESAHLSDDTVMWVYGEAGEAIGFDVTLRETGGGFWTPSVLGQAITLEIDAQRGGSIRLVSVAVIEEDVHGEATECFRDVACQSAAISNAATAVARYEFVRGSLVYVCSGALIIDQNATFPPYFLTANHCVSTAAEASSVEAFWDYRASACGAAPPTLASRPRSQGATLLATSTTTDTTLLRLSSVPGARYWLGWDPDHQPAGRVLSRVSHPSGGPQVYSESTVTTTSATCTTLPRGPFLYSVQTLGGAAAGSSGAPTFYGEGAYIVGQLLGACGPNVENPCDSRNFAVDGALEQSYAILQPYLAPGGAAQCGPCVGSATTACILGSRFKVTLTWNDSGANLSGVGGLIRYADNLPEISPGVGPVSESVFFSMYSFAPKSIEVLVRMLNGRGINNKYWVFVTGFTGAQYTVIVQDMQTCKVWQRNVPASATTVTKDFDAFPFP